MKTTSMIEKALLSILLIATFAATNVFAQSTTIDKPTKVELNLIEGGGDGKAETLYYYLDVNKGNVKVIVDAKTDDRSTPLRVTLMDEDGKELLPVYVVATGAGKREVASRKFVRSQRVIVKIATQDDPQVNLLTYKIRFDVPDDLPKQIVSASDPSTNSENSTSTTSEETSTITADKTPIGSVSAISSTSPEPIIGRLAKSTTKALVKTKAKKEAKKILSIIIDDE